MILSERLLEKAKEAFLMAIETYNKPSIRYRLEGFSFFICNAWELMLKAYLIKRDGENSIYFSNKPDRTISLENCIQKIFTNVSSPLRLNLIKIIELRNISTHFVTEEYDLVYVPLLQACVFNFVEKMKEFHEIDMTEMIPENFLNLSVRIQALNEEEILAKYSRQIAEKLINLQKTLTTMIEENNQFFAIRVEHHYYAVKDRNQATEFYHIENKAAKGVRIIKELKNPNETHKFSAKNCIREIGSRLKKAGIQLRFKGETVKFNRFHFGLFADYYQMKEDERFCFVHRTYEQPTYSYSQRAIDFIVEEIRKDPEKIIDSLKAKTKKANPRSKGF